MFTRQSVGDYEQDEDHQEDAFDYGAFATDDLEKDEEDTSLGSVVRCILAALKQRKRIGGELQFFRCWFVVETKQRSLLLMGEVA